MTQFLIIALTTAWFSLAFAIKGGFLNPYFKEYRDDSPVLFHALGSKALSAVSVLAYVVFMATFFQTHIGVAIQFKYSLLLIVAAWAYICTMRPWNEYSFILGVPESPYNHPRGGDKDALTVILWRGMASGGLLALVTGYTPFICFGALMPVVVYPILKKFQNSKGWGMTEWAIGAICYGIPFGLYISSLV